VLRYCSLILGLISLCALGSCAQVRISKLRTECDFSNDPRFASLNGKFPLSPAQFEAPPTVFQLGNKTRPTPEEKQAILEYDRVSEFCASEAMEIASRTDPVSVQGLFREMRVAVENQRRLLADGSITYGQCRQNSYLLLAQTQQVMGEYLRAQQIADAASTQAAAAHLNSTMQMLQTFNRKPSITTCNSFGNGITCTSN